MNGEGFVKALGRWDPSAWAFLTLLVLGLAVLGVSRWLDRRTRTGALANLEERDRVRRQSGVNLDDWGAVINRGIRR